MSTSTTKHDTAEATAPYALYAVARHMLDHRLPAPFSISPPGYTEVHVAVAVPGTALSAWVESIDVDSTDTEPLTTEHRTLRGHERVVVRGQIVAECGVVHVEVRSHQPARAELVSIAGGAA